MPIIVGHVPIIGVNHAPIVKGAWAHDRGVMCPWYRGQVPIILGSGAHYRGVSRTLFKSTSDVSGH